MIGADDAPEERLFPSNPSEPQADMTARGNDHRHGFLPRTVQESKRTEVQSLT